MRRADRLMHLISMLRDGRTHRAHDLATQLHVSLRTIYRDMDTLAASGVPVEGARGVGYYVTAPITLPPLNLTLIEMEALQIGLAAVGGHDDPDLSGAATVLLDKITALLPRDQHTPPSPRGLSIYPFADSADGVLHVTPLRRAIAGRQKLGLIINSRERRVRPLKLDFWGRLWVITVWCESTRAFDEIRLDQIDIIRILPSLFIDEPGKRLSDYAPA